MIAISVIIPVYKRTEWISLCIDKLLCQNFPLSHEVIIIDDGSPNEAEMRSAFEKSASECNHVRYLRNNHAGPAAARNLGVKSSSGAILCFLDDDSLPDSNWLREITAPFDLGDRADIVSGRTVSYYRKGMPLLLEQSVYPEKSWATCNIAYRRSVFEALGGFDEKSYTEPSWEDNDLGLRARWKGFRHVYAEGAIIFHPHEQSLPEYKKKCLMNGRGVAVFSRKYALKKPFWSAAAPLMMSRRLVYGFLPWIWMQKEQSRYYLKFLWSYYSLQGFFSNLFASK